MELKKRRKKQFALHTTTFFFNPLSKTFILHTYSQYCILFIIQYTLHNGSKYVKFCAKFVYNKLLTIYYCEYEKKMFWLFLQTLFLYQNYFLVEISDYKYCIGVHGGLNQNVGP